MRAAKTADDRRYCAGKAKELGRLEEFPDYDLCDMHIHIMPGVDDGSKDMNMSVRMMDVALDNAIGTMILTPHHKGGHHNVSPAQQVQRIDDMVDAAWDAGIRAMSWLDYRGDDGPELTGGSDYDSGGGIGYGGTRGPELIFYPGNEIMYDSGVAQRLEEGRIETMARSSYVLVEFRPEDPFARIQEGLRDLAWEGYHVILAHCERYDCLREDPDLARELWRSRIYLQVNADSVLPQGAAGKLPGSLGIRTNPVARFVHDLLSDEKISFVSTDAHRDVGRAPYMLECWRMLSGMYDPDYVREITRENTLSVIRDEEIR